MEQHFNAQQTIASDEETLVFAADADVNRRATSQLDCAYRG